MADAIAECHKTICKFVIGGVSSERLLVAQSSTCKMIV